jgi:hypothetical protein
MNELEDTHWKNLLAMSSPAFAGEAHPPYGFTTRTLARLREETRQLETAERIGLRAVFASLFLLLLTVVGTLGVDQLNRGDLEPGLRSIVQVENVPLS